MYKKSKILFLLLFATSGNLVAKSLYSSLCDYGCIRSEETIKLAEECNKHYGDGAYKKELKEIFLKHNSEILNREKMRSYIDEINQKYLMEYGGFRKKMIK
jgi:hypothetical protein